jgi:hypothetical protein
VLTPASREIKAKTNMAQIYIHFGILSCKFSFANLVARVGRTSVDVTCNLRIISCGKFDLLTYYFLPPFDDETLQIVLALSEFTMNDHQYHLRHLTRGFRLTISLGVTIESQANSLVQRQTHPSIDDEVAVV